MNEHTDFGVMSERDLPMLRDIYQIDVVRGPGSALYGPGALAMVINITTDNANTFKGFEVSQRIGAIEEHYTTELKYGRRLKDGAGLFLYGGISEYPGASLDNAPLTYGGYKNIGGWYPWRAYDYDEKARGRDAKRYNAAYNSQPKIKLHGEYTKDNLDVWLRYTQGGENVDLTHPWNTAWAASTSLPFGLGYRQATAALNYKQELADNFALKYMFSYMHTEMLTTPPEFTYRNYGEDEYYGQIIANWKINENHEFAFGGSWQHNEFGLPPWGEDEATNFRFQTTSNPGCVMPRWRTDMFSLFGEYQWRISDQLTAFASVRQDDHTHTEQMLSPRFSLIYTPTDVDTFKLMASRSVRTNNNTEMKKADMFGHSNSPAEVLKAYEARYERRVGDHIWLAADAFIHNQDMIGWVSEGAGFIGHTGPTGTEKLWGVEAEASYVRDRFRFDISHGFTKLLDYELAPGNFESEDTAAPMGHGNDLNNWYNNISKARVHYQMDDKLSLDSSLIVYWNCPGGEDYANWIPWNCDPRSHNVFHNVFNNNWYLNLGLQYQYSKNLTLRVDAYNILGLFDEDLNKRREGFNWSAPAEARIQPVALGFQLIYKF